MSNMTYVRFRNTSEDLEDCLEHINDANLSPEEEEARKRLVKLCRRVIADSDLDDGG